MSFSAKVFKVFIASPSDVAKERSIIKVVLNRWNEINAEKFQIILHPVGWDTHSSPEIGEHPQKIINKRLLKDCDLLIGVFWTRFGTPTYDYESGTEEEIEEHIKSGKPTMLYFSAQPVVPGSYDLEQFAKVQSFKDKCKTRGIYQDYTSIEEFQKVMSDHIQMKINTESIFSIGSPQEIVSFETPINVISVELSEESKELLREAAKDPHGNVLSLSTPNGKIIQTNGSNLNSENSARSRAIWEQALNDLENKGLIESTNYKREVFKVTKLGYDVADLL